MPDPTGTAGTRRPRGRLEAVAESLGLTGGLIEMHGPDRAKVNLEAIQPGSASGHYVLVTAITPTAAGEGKTVTSIGLSMALARLGFRTSVNLRQSSLGPTLGLKGGGAGGGAARIEPLEEALLGMGSDLFAVESATNLLAAMLDEAVRRGSVDVDLETADWRRVIDMDDRSLRHIDVDAGRTPHRTGFEITAASEVMAILALSRDLDDLRARLGRIVPAFDRSGRPLVAESLRAAGAMAVLLRHAIRPNLLQTTEGTPAFVHTGPFGNIATGNSSIVADLVALPRVDYLVSEAGFGADLGAEKFLHIKLPLLGRVPDVIVLVATVPSLKLHSGLPDVTADSLNSENVPAVAAGAANLRRHLANLKSFGLPVVVAINRHPADTTSELALLRSVALEAGAVAVAESDAFRCGGEGALPVAEAVVAAASRPGAFTPLLDPADPPQMKVAKLATGLYGAGGVTWSPAASAALERFVAAGYGSLPVCMAKTHLSLSHDPALKGAPAGYQFPVKEVRLAAGAGLLKVFAGPILTMPGMPAQPRAMEMDLAPDGTVVGLV